MKEQRYDRIDFDRPVMTTEGYVRGMPVVTRTGVFRYMNADGSIRKELRHPDDVMKSESLDSLKGIPVTLEHPSELVNASNANKYQKGFTGDHVQVDGNLIKVNITVTHKDAVDSIQAGKNQLSLGYELELIEEVGEYNGEQYDYRQTNIDYNHLSIVDLARAGSVANIKMDSGIDALISMDSIQQNDDSNPKTEEFVKMAKFNCDGKTHEIPDEVMTHIDSVTGDRDAKVARLTNLDKEIGTLKGENDALKTEVANLKNANSDTAINAKAQALLKLNTDARVVLGKDANLDGLGEMAIIDMANKKFNGDVAVEGSEDYKKAFFAIAVKTGNTDAQDIAVQRETVNKPADKNADSAELYNFDGEDDDRNEMMNGFAKRNK